MFFWALNCLNLFIFFCSTVKTFSKSWCVYCVCESHSLILMLEQKASVSLLWFDFFVKREKPLVVLLSDDFWKVVFLCFGYSKNNRKKFLKVLNLKKGLFWTFIKLHSAVTLSIWQFRTSFFYVRILDKNIVTGF